MTSSLGSAPILKFEKVRTQTMREQISTGVLNELEFGLLKGSSKGKSGDKILGWGVEDKGVLLNMEVDQLTATQGSKKLEVQVRSLCYSRGVTADYLKSAERFNMKQCIMVLGDLGKGVAPWSELVQTAVYLHRKEFNIIWIDVPSFKSNPQMWLKFGAETIRGLLKFLCVKQVSVVSRGIGGAVFLEALAKAPELFARTHFIYNMDLPAGKGVHLPIFELEEVLRKRELQLWFGFKDDEAYDRFVDGSPQRAYDAVQKIQARLVGERQRGRRTLTYDEVLITENLNANPNKQHVQSLELSIYTILVFSSAMLESISFFLEIALGTHQEGMEDGLVGDFRATAHMEALADGEGAGEPLAIRRNRIGHLHGLLDRRDRAKVNKRMFDNVAEATTNMMLALPDVNVQNASVPGFQDELTKRLEDGGSEASGSRTNSRGGSRASGSLVGTRVGTKDISGSQLGSGSRGGTKDIGGSQGGSRGGTKDFNSSRGGSRVSTKDGESGARGSVVSLTPALPALLKSSASAPSLQNSRGGSRVSTKDGESGAPALVALANHPANEDSEEEEEEGSLFDVLGTSKQRIPGQQPWQQYRKMWQEMHGKAPSGYTHPMSAI